MRAHMPAIQVAKCARVMVAASALALVADLAIAYVFVICGPFPESAWPA